ncbi:bifunctional Mitochondrial substrate-solute carrier/Mitochondrial carrier domain superfamily/NAD-FAD transporter SLC25A32-like [Babesia duncani]|uniref:Bifunctional Mitochondrial substrate-solute carrier/Mitochondrial carrier domain superfamily/NAD-FAD transporter SLC25A32-like n=1 Tax=Babesia duncani TaxID=323732 RepID=A0AAD9PKI8_9APIC|nr:bifunctional Mitochondrial substrate-solute carrier/Mitochondrial carrier domain superfamily/NAD-FAD transporter SLC25A32-like [Babesia duncani]
MANSQLYNEQQIDEYKRIPIISAASNAFAAGVVATLVQPLSAIRTRMQSLNIYGHGLKDKQRQLWPLLMTCKKDGILSLYKGTTVAVGLTTASWFLFRFIFDTTSRLEWISQQPKLTRDLACGCISGFSSTLLLHPFWNARLNLELQSKRTLVDKWPQYRGAFHYIFYNLKHNGFGSLYIAKETTLVTVPHYVMVICLYENLSKIDFNSSRFAPITQIQPFITGTISKFIPALICYPIYVCRTMQLCHGTSMYNCSLHRVLFSTMLNGPSALYAGFQVQAFKSLINGGLLFALYEHVHRNMAKLAITLDSKLGKIEPL